MRDLEFMWNGGNTRRFHTMPTLTIDTVGHHSFNLLCILLFLREDLPAHVLRAALKHDIAEHVVGDMPAPTKRALPNYMGVRTPTGHISERSFREAFGEHEAKVAEAHGVNLEEDALSDAEKWLLKLADALDGMRFCIQERRMGNWHPKLVEAFSNFRSYVATLIYGSVVTPLDELHAVEVSEHAQSQDRRLYRYLCTEWTNAR